MIEPIQKLYKRMEFDKNDGDNSHFDCLMIFFEMLTKIFILGALSGIKRDKENTKESLFYDILNSNSLGNWVTILNKAFSGPSYNIMHWTDNEKREVNLKHDHEAWQHQIYINLSKCINTLDSSTQIYNQSSKYSFIDSLLKFVELRNRNAHGATPILLYEKMIPLLSKAIDLFIDNCFVFKKEWSYVNTKINGKYFVHNISDAIPKTNLLIEQTEGKCFDGIYIFIEDNLYKIDLIHFDPHKRIYYFPNGNFRNGLFESLCYDNNDKIEISLDRYIKPPGVLKESETKSTGKLDALFSRTFSNIPNKPTGYIERKELEDKLYSLLNNNDSHPIITLHGRGGIGKTSLALIILWKLAQKGNYDAIIWFSARDIDLYIEGPKTIKPDILNIEDISKQYSKLMEPPESINKGFSFKSFFKENLSRSIFERTLFVFDNFETIIDQEKTFHFFDENIRPPNKILVTTRVRNSKGDYEFEITGMDKNQTFALIDEMATNYGIRSKIDKSLKEKIYLQSGGHPYVTKILVGQFAKGDKLLNLNRTPIFKESILNSLFERTYSQLSIEAVRAFLTLCTWKTTIPRFIFESVLMYTIPESNVEKAVDELKNYSFIEISEYNGNEFISVPTVAYIFGKQKYSTFVEKIDVDNDSKLLQMFGAYTDNRTDIETRIRKFLENSELILNIDQQIELVDLIGYKYVNAWYYLAIYLKEKSELTKSKEYIEKFIQNTIINDDVNPLLSLAWYALYSICFEMENWRCAFNALIERARLKDLPYLSLSLIANNINSLLKNHGLDIKPKEKERVNEVIKAMTLRESEANATDYSRIAWMYWNLHQRDKTREMAEKGLSMDYTDYHCNKILEKLIRS